uniref:Uncharacterized protein n=1 Tax=Fusarium oxysporum (strain Fo5176) TaxID=660025 RepID=A0A0D2XKQ6_FUSOF
MMQFEQPITLDIIHASLEVEIWARRIGSVKVEVGGCQVLDHGYEGVKVGLPVACASLENLQQVRCREEFRLLGSLYDRLFRLRIEKWLWHAKLVLLELLTEQVVDSEWS